MGLFEMGAEDGYDDNAGMVDYGPGDVRAKVAATDKEMTAVNALVPGSKLPAARKAAWAGVFAKWGEFKARVSGLFNSPALLRDSTFRIAGDFAAAAAKVRGEIAGGGVRLPPPAATPAPAAGFKVPWKPLLIYGGLAVGGYFLYRFFRKPDTAAPALPAPADAPPVFVMPPYFGAPLAMGARS